MLEMSVADCIWFRPKLLKLLVSDEPAREVMGESLSGVLASWLSHNPTQKSKGNGGAQDDSCKVNAVGDVHQPNPATTARVRRAARGIYPETQ